MIVQPFQNERVFLLPKFTHSLQILCSEQSELLPSRWNNSCQMMANNYIMLTVILILAGLICFWLFFKSIDFLEKI